MSTSPSRRRRLQIARQLPPQECPGCGTPLERVAVVSAHLKRCDRILAEEQARLAAALGGAG